MLRRLILVVVMLTTVLAGCSFIPGLSSDTDGTLTFDGAVQHGIAPGETIPGTTIRFVAATNDGAEVIINDQRALKKVGDSLDWQAMVAPGINVSMPQRIALITPERLQTVGTVRVAVTGVSPLPAPVPAGGRYTYRVTTGYTVRMGERVPGTTLVYEGQTAEQGAQFAGTNDYPYRRVGDSVSWKGQLAPGAYLDTTFRVVAYTDDIVTLAGLATIIVQ